MKMNVQRPYTVTIGYQGENEVQFIQFDFESWHTTVGEGTLALLVKRNGDAEAYPVSLTVDGTKATWLISNVDTSKVGDGEAQLQYLVDSAIKKSCVFAIKVLPSIGESSETPPDPYISWIQKMLDCAEEVEQNATIASQSAENASNSEQNALDYKNLALEYKNDSEANKQATQEYKDLALGYKNSAEASATTATDAKDTAVSAKNTATSASTTATEKANIATTKAGEALQSASDALQYRNEAKHYAETAVPYDFIDTNNDGNITVRRVD